MKLEFSHDRFLKNTGISNFMKIRLNGSRVVPCGRTNGRDGQTDTHDEATSRFSQFCERA